MVLLLRRLVDRLTVVRLEAATFAPHVGSRFEFVPAAGDPFEATLSGCEVTGAERLGRVPFTLSFHAPAGTGAPQQTFTVRHAELGELALFMVPLGPDERGARYEAVVG
jgi:hypothetical protein